MRFRMSRSLLLLAGFVLFAGCRQYEGSDQTEKEHPRIEEARERVKQQDLAGAEALLLEVLRKNPDLVLAHLELGMVYQTQERPVDALYHFQRYLEARPDSRKAVFLRPVVEDERRRLADQVDRGGTGEVPPEETRVEELRLQLAAAEQRLAETEVLLQQARLRRGAVSETPPPEWAGERLALLQKIEELQSRTPVSPPDSGNQEGSPVSEIRTYTVRRGDTLSGIALKTYGRASEWQKIYEANRVQIPNKNVLSPGTVLKLP